MKVIDHFRQKQGLAIADRRDQICQKPTKLKSQLSVLKKVQSDYI